MTQLDCGSIEAYHLFEVPKRGKAKKPSIFLTLGYIKSRIATELGDEQGTNIETRSATFPCKIMLMYEGEKHDP